MNLAHPMNARRLKVFSNKANISNVSLFHVFHMFTIVRHVHIILNVSIFDNKDEETALDEIKHALSNQLKVDPEDIKLTKDKDNEIKYKITPKNKTDAQRIQKSVENLDFDQIEKQVKEKFPGISVADQKQNRRNKC